MGPGNYDFATLVLYVASSLEFCNHSKELEHTKLFAMMEEIVQTPIATMSHVPQVSDPC